MTTRAFAQPVFSKSFAPSTIGPGSATELVYTIDNSGGAATDTIAFAHTLPVGVTLATPALATSDCVDAIINASDGGGAVSLFGARLGANQRCTVSVYITSSVLGAHASVTGDLTSSAGNSGTASSTVTVASNRPGISALLSPSTVPWGDTSTLTVTIDNTGNPGAVGVLNFAYDLGSARIASPNNASTDCPDIGIEAASGSRSITVSPSVFAFGLAAGSSCTVSVDIRAASVGSLDLVSSSATVFSGTTVDVGRAVSRLVSTRSPIHLQAEFIDDPIAQGNTGILRFSIFNDRDDAATNIALSHDLGAALSSLSAVGLPPSDPCGAGSQLSGTTSLSFTGGALPARGSCTFDISVLVPAAAAMGVYAVTTSAITADLGVTPTTGNASTARLFVAAVPTLTQVMTPAPVATGGTLAIEFTITNTSVTDTVTGLAFIDEISAFLPGATSVSLPASNFCGSGSTMVWTSFDVDRLGLSMTGGSLAPGATCVFTAEVSVPAGMANGIYTNTTGAIVGTLGGTSVTGDVSVANVAVVAPPSFSKSFAPGAHAPGATIALEYSLSLDENAVADATSISFTDDLGSVLAGLAATGTPTADVCGAGSQLSGTTTLTLTGGVLAPGASCTFTVMVTIPMAASGGSYASTTGAVTATIDGLAASGLSAVDTLVVSTLRFTHDYTDDPVRPGDTVTLEFTIANDGDDDATGLFFTHDLNQVTTALASTSGTLNDVCGAGSQVSGTTFLIVTGGNLLAGTSCTFSVTVSVPSSTVADSYNSRTGNLSGTVGGGGVVHPASVAQLVVADPLMISKRFMSGFAIPGGTVELEFTLANADADDSVTALSFTDDLDAALAGLVAMGLPANDVCGTGSTISGTDLLTFTGGSLAAGASCVFSITLQVPESVTPGTGIANITSSLSGNYGGTTLTADPAVADADIRFVAMQKSFNTSENPGGSTTLSYTVTNNSTDILSELTFSDALNSVIAGAVVSDPPSSGFCGPDSEIQVGASVGVRDISLAAGAACTFDVTVTWPASAMPGDYNSETSMPTTQGQAVGAPAIASFTILPNLPELSLLLSLSEMTVADVATMTATISNSANVVAVNGLAVAVSLPAGLMPVGEATTTCTGGTVTTSMEQGEVSLADGVVAAGDSCTIVVDVAAGDVGDYLVTASLRSEAGDSSVAMVSLSVIEAAIDAGCCSVVDTRLPIEAGFVVLVLCIGAMRARRRRDV